MSKPRDEREIAYQKAIEFLIEEIKWGNNTVEKLMSSMPYRGCFACSVGVDAADHRFINVEINMKNKYVFDLQKLFNVAAKMETGQLSLV